MRIHPRTLPVNKFKNALSLYILDSMKDFELTPSEIFYILSSEMLSWANLYIRAERNPEEKDA